MSNNNKSSSKKYKQGKIDINFDDSALMVNYEVETLQHDNNGNVVFVDRKNEVRQIKIKSLTMDKDMNQLASDIVDKCKYIHPSRIDEVEQLLIRLRGHHLMTSKSNGNSNTNSSSSSINNYDESYPTIIDKDKDSNGKDRDRASNRGRERERDIGRERERDNGRDRDRESNTGMKSSSNRGSSSARQRDNNNYSSSSSNSNEVDSLPPATMDDVEHYLDMLYTVSGKTDREKEAGLRLQEQGTLMFLKLCRDVMNLEQLIQNNTVMGALTRVLQEEYKKSMELTFNILRIFLAFSNFSEMHVLMANYRIGMLTMKAIEFEMKRIEVIETEKTLREQEYSAELENAKSTDIVTYPSILEKIRKLREKDNQKHHSMIRKQDKLLFVSFYILLNLAEDLIVEKKMMKKQLINLISMTLTRRFEDLLILCVTFLKKLSVVGENKDAIKQLSTPLDQLIKFVACSSQPLVTITLRLLFNMSFDKDFRDQMLKGGIVPKLISLLKTPSFRGKTLKLLYHLSVDDRCKSMVTYTDGIPILMGLVINFPQDYLASELAALMINLSYNARNVEQMIANKGLNLLMDRLADKRDPLLLKIIRNISLWTFKQQEELENPELQYKYRGLWSPHIKLLIEILKDDDSSHDVQIEIFGCLANMTMYDLPATSNWKKLMRDYNLLNLFCKMLVPGMALNDVILEIVMLISTIASDADACAMIASSTLIGLLYQLWEEKRNNDTELLLQLIHCFHKLFLFDTSREEAMYSTRIVIDIIDCLNHKSIMVRQKATQMCDIVLEFDRDKNGDFGNLGKKIIQKKFESYNKVWLANASFDEYDDSDNNNGTNRYGNKIDNSVSERKSSSSSDNPLHRTSMLAHTNNSNIMYEMKLDDSGYLP